jgi:hydroxyacylglutathione hydrolase/adenylyltransferase/sulfurtransferase
MSVFADAAGFDLEPERVEEMLRAGEDVQVIDVREPYEREAGHIDGTRHVELERLASQAETIDRGRPVVFYCRLGARSGMAAQAFRAAGWDAYNMHGGITLWDERGLPLHPEGGHVADH